MVAFSSYYGNKQRGSGIMDNLMKPFTYEKYKGERHGYSLNPKTFFYNRSRILAQTLLI